MTWFAYSTLWVIGLSGTIIALVDDPWLVGLWLILTWLGYIGVLLGGAWYINWNFYLVSVNRGPGYLGNIAFTFEGEMVSANLSKLLILLKNENIPVTFFWFGQSIGPQAQWIKKTEAEGHQIGQSAFAPLPSTGWHLPWKTITQDIQKTHMTFTTTLGKAPGYIRLPLGTARPGLGRWLHRQSLISVGWDISVPFSSFTHAQQITDIVRKVRNGSILRFTCSGGKPGIDEKEWERLREGLRKVIEGLRERGFRFVRIDHLLEMSGSAMGG
jgi:peptidoglycan-N-acetylglucosamine deacetylase